MHEINTVNPRFLVFMSRLLLHFKSVKGNAEKIERITLRKRQNELNYETKQEKNQRNNA